VSDAPFLFCLYAEDVRQEVSGQTSFIGVFQGGLRVAAVPTNIPKLAVIANLWLPSSTVPQSIKLEVLRGQEVLQTIEPPDDFLKSVDAQKNTLRKNGYTMQFVVGFVGFPVHEEGLLEVRATVDGAVVLGNALEITVGAP
jgi:hypothetical protein